MEPMFPRLFEPRTETSLLPGAAALRAGRPRSLCRDAQPADRHRPRVAPGLADYRGHGIERITAWCLTPFRCRQGTVTIRRAGCAWRPRDDEAAGCEAAAQMQQVRRAACGF